MSENIFEQATRQKLRFRSTNGLVSAEDLWDIGLEQLDNIAKTLRKTLRETEDSFIDSKKVNVPLELQFAVVKHIITTKMAERDAKIAERERAARKQVIMQALEAKQSDALHRMSAAELQAELDKLG